MPNFNDSMKAKVAPAAINTGLDRPAGTGSTNDLLYTKWGGSTGSINDAGNTYFNTATGPTFRAASSTTTITGGGGFTLTSPTGTTVGDVLIVQMWVEYDFKSGSVGTAPAGWTLRGTGDDASYPYLPWRTFSRVATGTDSFVWSGGANWIILDAAMIAVSGATAVDVAGTRTLTAIASSVTTTTSPTLLVGLFAVLENTIAAPASMTARSTVTQTNQSLIIATETLSASGATGTRTCPTTSVSLRYAQLIAVK